MQQDGARGVQCIPWQHHADVAVSAAACGPGRRPRAAAAVRSSARDTLPRDEGATAPRPHAPPSTGMRWHGSVDHGVDDARRHAMVHGVNDWSGKIMLCLMVISDLVTMCERIGNASAHGAVTIQHPLEIRTSRDVRIRNGGCGLL